MIPFNKGIFKAPKYSSFDLSHDNKLTYGFGDLIPAYWTVMFPGDRVRTDVGFLTRFAPMLAPVMQRFDLTIDWHFVPMRLILGESTAEQFFNLSNPDNPGSLPRLALSRYMPVVSDKNLLDYLDYPQVSNLYEAFKKSLLNPSSGVEYANGSFTFNMFTSSDANDGTYLGVYGTTADRVTKMTFFSPIGGNDGTLYVSIEPSDGTLKGLLAWVSTKYGIGNLAKASMWSLSEICERVGSDAATEVREYYNYLWNFLWESVVENGDIDASGFNHWPLWFRFYFTSQLVTSQQTFSFNDLPLRAYWRIVFDWYVDNSLYSTTSGNIYADWFTDSGTSFDFADRYLDIRSWDNNNVTRFDLYKPYKRNFAKDYFTSAFVSPQMGSDVLIPVNGTIADLRQANWLQKLKERLAWIGSKRYKDVNKGIFNVDSSDSRLDRAEVLSRHVTSLDIQTVVQTNQGDVDTALKTPIGNMSGMSNTRGGSFGCDYLAEEHGVLMCLVSVRPRSSYPTAVKRELFKTSPYEFLWPQFAQLGEQSIENRELYSDFDKNITATNKDTYLDKYKQEFGFQRRYGEYMFEFDTVHGLFRNSMDYWHDGRQFNTIPSLSQEFLEIDSEVNDLNRIFAVESDPMPIYQYLYFDIKAVRPLPRYINYDL